jgi:hypothetical protein
MVGERNSGDSVVGESNGRDFSADTIGGSLSELPM